MTIDNKGLIQVWKVHVRGASSQGGPRGVMIEFSPTEEAYQAAGTPEGARLPSFRFILTENIARQLAAAIPRQLQPKGDGAPDGETIH